MKISKLVWSVLILASGIICASQVYADDSQAREILRQARAAIGADSRDTISDESVCGREPRRGFWLC